jgi:hypothetical protein
MSSVNTEAEEGRLEASDDVSAFEPQVPLLLGERASRGQHIREEPTYVYAIGQIEPRFGTLAAEKEFAQISLRSDTAGMTDREVVASLLSERRNRYLARELCWIFSVETIPTYLLYPRDPLQIDDLVESLRPRPSTGDTDVVIGVLGNIARPEICNGLMLPLVYFDQLYSFDVESLIRSIPVPEGTGAEEFEASSREVFSRVVQVSDNAGTFDEHRAVNYLSVRYPAIYVLAYEMFGRDYSLTAVEASRSKLSGARRLVDVVFRFTSRASDYVERFFVRVDVTEKFPFLVGGLGTYLDR